MYLLNAYKFWLIKNTSEETDVNNKLTALIKLLVEDPTDFCEKAKLLLYWRGLVGKNGPTEPN